MNPWQSVALEAATDDDLRERLRQWGATAVPLVGTAVDVPGWGDAQTCHVCGHAYDDAAQPGCPHASEPLCPTCAEGCRPCAAEGRQEVAGR